MQLIKFDVYLCGPDGNDALSAAHSNNQVSKVKMEQVDISILDQELKLCLSIIFCQ